MKPEGHEDELKTSVAVQDYMAQYAASVILDRAIPDLRDGMKPIQRRLLYTMWKMGLVNGKHTKLNNIGGATMVLHPHGDGSPALYGLSAEWLNNVPMGIIDGNGGTIYQSVSGAAATRYTSGSLSKAAEYLMHGLHENAVDFVPNYDESTTEPTVLPSEYPNALMNSVDGIAVGVATHIVPHNPREILDAILYYIDHPNTTPKRLSQIIKGPDFPTGGLLVDSEDANLRELTYGKVGKLNKSDKGATRYVVRGEAEIVSDQKEPRIKFTSIPYGETLDDVIDSFNKFVLDHPDIGIVDFRDFTNDYDDIDIEIVFRRNTSRLVLEQVLALLYQKTSIESTLSPNNMMITHGHPASVSIVQYFHDWLEFRKEFTRREFKYELKHYEQRLEIVEGLLHLIDISDQVVKDAHDSKNKTNFKHILTKKYDFTIRQAEAIATLPLYRIGKQDCRKLNTEQSHLHTEIERLNHLLEDDRAFINEIKKELRHIKNTVFKDATRRTKLVHETKVDKIEINTAKLVKKQDVVVVVKRNGSVQRMSQQVYDNNIDEYDDKDNLVATLNANTQQGGLFFTKDGLAYFRFVNELENLNIKKDAESVQRVIPSYKSNDETIGGLTFDMPLKDQYVLSVSKLGRVKLTDLSKVIPSTSTKRYLKNTSKYFGLRDTDDEVIFARGLAKDDLDGLTLTVHRSMGRTKEKQIDVSKMNAQAGSGAGTRIWKLKDGDAICDVELELAREQNDNDAVEQQDE